jgi:hypothetical protein
MIGKTFWFSFLVFIFCCTCVTVLAEESAWDKFVPPPDDKYDWIQLTSGEWLKGELKVLYDYEIEFDSDKLDLLTIDLDDVKQIRTHKPISIRFDDRQLSDKPVVMEGVLTLKDDKVVLTVDGGIKEFERKQLISIAQAAEKEVMLWSADVSLGVNFRGGNTDSIDTNLQANVERSTASTRMVLDYIGNYSEADNQETSQNHRISGYRDSFISKKYFWRQFTGEYYRDPFKNVDHQLSLMTAFGYHIIFNSKTTWDISAGIGGRYTKFKSVEPGKSSDDISPGFGAGTMYDSELNKWIDLLVDYNFMIVNEDNGTYTHHFITTLSTELTDDFDFDISFIWDRIRKPQPNSDGTVPEKDDTQLIIGLSYDY